MSPKRRLERVDVRLSIRYRSRKTGRYVSKDKIGKLGKDQIKAEVWRYRPDLKMTKRLFVGRRWERRKHPYTALDLKKRVRDFFRKKKMKLKIRNGEVYYERTFALPQDKRKKSKKGKNTRKKTEAKPFARKLSKPKRPTKSQLVRQAQKYLETVKEET